MVNSRTLRGRKHYETHTETGGKGTPFTFAIRKIRRYYDRDTFEIHWYRSSLNLEVSHNALCLINTYILPATYLWNSQVHSGLYYDVLKLFICKHWLVQEKYGGWWIMCIYWVSHVYNWICSKKYCHWRVVWQISNKFHCYSNYSIILYLNQQLVTNLISYSHLS